MGVLSVLGGLLLLLLGICGAGACLGTCYEHRSEVQTPAAAPARLPVPAALRLAFPPRLGAWIATGELQAHPGGSATCAYERAGQICRLSLNRTSTEHPLQAFGNDLPEGRVPQGWRFFRHMPAGGFLAGWGDAWTLEDEVWVSRGLAGRLTLDTPSQESAEELLREISVDQLEAALKAL